MLFFSCQSQLLIHSRKVCGPVADPHFQLITRLAQSLFRSLMFGNVIADAQNFNYSPLAIQARFISPGNPHLLAGSPHMPILGSKCFLV